MNKLIIFLSSILLLSTVQATLTKRLKEKLFEPKNCLPRIIENYTYSNAPSYSIQSDEAMLELCPNLHESCCLKNNLNDLHQLVLDAISSLNSFESQYKYLIESIFNATSNNLESFITKFKTKIQGDNIEEFDEEDEDLVQLKAALEYVNSHRSVILEDLESSIALYISVNSRYACAICNRENLFSFKNMKSRNPTLMLDLAQCKNIVSDPHILSMFRIDNHTGYLYTIIRAMALVENGTAPNDKFLSDEELSNLPNLISTCQEGSNFTSKSECQSLCLSLKFFNENPFYAIQKSIVAGSLLVDHYIKGRPKKDQKELNIEYEEYVNKIVKVFFLMPHKKSPYMIERFDKLYSWNSGWNIMNFEMNYDVPVKKVIRSDEEDFVLRAARKPEEMFEIIVKNIPMVDDNSTRIISFVIMAVTFLIFSN